MSEELERAPVQRVTFGGVAATLSTVSAVIVALASMFTAVQAMQISQASAQEKLFEEQLNTCVALNDVETSSLAANGDVSFFLEDHGPDFDAKEVEQLRAYMDKHDDEAGVLNKQYSVSTMLLPDKAVHDAAYDAYSKHIDLNELGWAVLERAAVTTGERTRWEALLREEEALLDKAFEGCRKYVAGVVDGGRIFN